MPCLKQKFGENYKMEYINYFSDITFQQLDDPKVLPIELQLMSLVILKSDDDQMMTKLKEVCVEATQ